MSATKVNLYTESPLRAQKPFEESTTMRNADMFITPYSISLKVIIYLYMTLRRDVEIPITCSFFFVIITYLHIGTLASNTTLLQDTKRHLNENP